MDFLKIRQKARERAAARAEGAAEPRPPDAPPPTAPPPPEADADAGALEVDLVESALADRLQGLPAVDEGFTAWRPGSGAPPPVALDAPAPRAGELAAPRPHDLEVVVGAAPVPALPAGPTPASAPRAPPPAPDAGAADPLREFFYREDEEAPPVPLATRADAPAHEDADSIAREEYLTFLLGREEYAVAIERVREVLKAPPITEVPRAPAAVLGVVTVRGEVVAVFDPRRRLGLPGAPPEPGAGRVVIVEAGDGPCGLLVDAVASVVRLRPGTIEPCPQGIGGASADCLAGIGRQGDRLFTVLDLGALLRRAAAPARRVDEEERRARP